MFMYTNNTTQHLFVSWGKERGKGEGVGGRGRGRYVCL